MNMVKDEVEAHYARSDLLDTIVGALREAGKDPNRLTPADLAPVDQFHIRGREATLELAQRAALRPGLQVLDVGCGLGGSVRYMASEHRCVATGVDLTAEYIDVARVLADMVGLGRAVEFLRCNALDMPFDDAAFDVVWTEHVQMNIADKAGFYAEIARVLVPGGRLVFHDVFAGEGGAPHYPVPWAEDAAISHLVTPVSARELIDEAGMQIVDWVDQSQASEAWFAAATDRLKLVGPPPFGVHLLMGSTARRKMENITRNLHEGRIVVVQAVAERVGPYERDLQDA